MKVIFLDIDGVLNSSFYDKNKKTSTEGNIDETRVFLLKIIIDRTEAKIVLSSSWKKHWNVEPSLCDLDGIYINSIFQKYNLSIYDKTPQLDDKFNRKKEILEWLKNKKDIDNFIILDDYAFGWEELTDKVIKTNPIFGLGLEDIHVEKAITLLTS